MKSSFGTPSLPGDPGAISKLQALFHHRSARNLRDRLPARRSGSAPFMNRNLHTSVIALLCGCLVSAPHLPAQTEPNSNAIFRRENLAAWCIVPFDAKKRGPEERAAMLEKMGVRKFVYDYRAEHVPQWDEELNALKKHRVELLGWWFPTTLNDEAKRTLALFKATV
jgi:hypothetical protein